ncbi:MAG TPA: hypothetical protein VIS52_07960 [Motiliproteus sp.]
MEGRPTDTRSPNKKIQRLCGTVHVYLRDQGVGLIKCDEREFRFGVTDVVGNAQPQEGDRVSFMPQLLGEQYRARRVELQLDKQQLDRSPNSARLAQEVRPSSAELVRAAKVRAKVHTSHPSAREHIRCGSCRRLVIPKMVRVKGGVLRGSGERWVESCPRCKGSLDGKTSSARKLWATTAAAIGGAVVVTRSFFF